ncbi:hypothetical protein EC968_007038 [Mortierella alpina]|nr:hypothetical protein EC968_007038 [Mortierella alpina]
MRTRIALVVLLGCLSSGLAEAATPLQECLRNHHQLKQMKDLMRFGNDDLFSDEGKSLATGYIEYAPFGKAGESICFAGNDPNPYQDFYDPPPKKIAEELKPYYYVFCPVPSANTGKNELCSFKDMNVKARFRVLPLKYQNCATSQCKTTTSKKTTSTTSISGNINFAPVFLDKLGLSVSFTAGLTNSVEYSLTSEQTVAKNESAYLVGITVELQTNIQSVSISKIVGRVYNKDDEGVITDQGKCTENYYTSPKPISNNYLMADKKETIWISCDKYYENAKRQLYPITKRGDADDVGDLGGEECFYYEGDKMIFGPCD